MLPKDVGFIVVYEPSPLFDTVFHDLTSHENVYLVREIFDKNILRRLLKKRKIQKLTGGYLNFLVNEHFALCRKLDEIADEYSEIWVLLLNYAFTTTQMPASALQKLKEKFPHIKFALYYYDGVNTPASFLADFVREKFNFDCVYTFEKTDAERYGLKFWPSPYSTLLNVPVQKVDKDLYFCGRSGNAVRRAIYLDVLDRCRENSVNADMDILVLQDANYYNRFTDMARIHRAGDIVPYPQVLERTLRAKCILDVVLPYHTGLSLRPYEAVCYNRKLLTNNKSILDFPYYDSRYMQYFETVEEIDWDWVKEDIPVDYGYDCKFSPMRLLEHMVSFCE